MPVEYQGEVLTMAALADRFNLPLTTLHNRYVRAGCPQVIPESMVALNPRQAGCPAQHCTIDGVHYTSTWKASLTLGVPYRWIEKRLRTLGSRTVSTEQLLVSPPPTRNEGTAEWRGLSATRNHGGGRGEIPDDLWSNRGRNRPGMTVAVLRL